MSLEGRQFDRYRIVRLLGSGGMGEVYLAEDPHLERQVAIKVIRSEPGPYPDTSSDAQNAARLFEREARAVAKLDNHAHILSLFDYGEQTVDHTNHIYLVMPYCEEGSLADWLRRRGQIEPLSPLDVAYFVSQAASALQHAHDHQIIHQDVKPSNFLLRSRADNPTHPDLLLADFGIARVSTATSNSSQAMRGTPTTMAPEQWEGHPVFATDQYALAVMAFELLTGHPLFQGTMNVLMYKHLIEPPPRPSSFNSRLSKDIDAVILHALAKSAESRFPSITAFANALQQAAQGQPMGTNMFASAASLPTSLGDIRAPLGISPEEAQTGTSRTLTIGDRSVFVPVPPGVQNDFELRLDGQGEISLIDGRRGALILTICIQRKDATPPSYSTQPILGVDEHAPAPSVADVTGNTHAPTASSTRIPKSRSSSWFRRAVALLIGTVPLAAIAPWLVKLFIILGYTPPPIEFAKAIGTLIALPFLAGIITLAFSGRPKSLGIGFLSGLLFWAVFFGAAFWGDRSLSSLSPILGESQLIPLLLIAFLFFEFLACLGAGTYIGTSVGIRNGKIKHARKKLRQKETSLYY